MSFDSLGLKAELLRAVSDEGYETPTSVQQQAIPLILDRRDILAGAQTGTGKTAGFTLPILQLLTESPRPAGRGRGPRSTPVRVLILTPTRELAAQVQESVRTYGRYLPRIRSTAIFGGVGIVPQMNVLRRGVDVIVATPGRLQDHLTQKTVDLSQVEILVLDEADRMLDMGFIRPIRKILGYLPRKRQNLLFSATFSDEILKLAGEFLRSPEHIQVAARNAAPELVTQVVHPVDRSRKRALLSHLIHFGDWEQVLVFTRTKHGANRLAQQLDIDGISSAAIHGNKSQAQRTKALKDFKRGAVRVLVATDIAARGLDIDQLPHVVNYELPNVPEDYVHRIGRTGRAGNEGAAVSLVCGEERDLLRDIERVLRRSLPSEIIEGFTPRNQPHAEDRAGGKRGGERVRPGRKTAGKPPRSRRAPAKAEHARSGNGSRPSGNGRPTEGGGSRPSTPGKPAPTLGRAPRKAQTASRRRRGRPGRRRAPSA